MLRSVDPLYGGLRQKAYVQKLRRYRTDVRWIIFQIAIGCELRRML